MTALRVLSLFWHRKAITHFNILVFQE